MRVAAFWRGYPLFLCSKTDQNGVKTPEMIRMFEKMAVYGGIGHLKMHTCIIAKLRMQFCIEFFI